MGSDFVGTTAKFLCERTILNRKKDKKEVFDLWELSHFIEER
ncbi:hypothetical protein [Leptospira noguchii]|uniref:Uncharacterized protein n=1 Tax=Leptospira noguchii TaxID=28182 RepID=M6VQA6_9LEPT|nr:hypothetical protein [Leptospira noguchii]EMO55244.1 hypothetical protein LEP1GSC172_3939 [Leptospira noguchii]